MNFVQFIHIPKCGGNSVNQVLKDLNLYNSRAGHKTYRTYVTDLPAKYYFTTIRNPWDRAVSIYEYFKKVGPTKDQDQTFDQFMELRHEEMGKKHFYGDRQACRLITWAAQTSWLVDKHDVLVPEIKILRLENLQQELTALLTNWGLPIPEIPHLNATKRRPYQEYFDNKWKDYISVVYRDDIINFGYTF